MSESKKLLASDLIFVYNSVFLDLITKKTEMNVEVCIKKIEDAAYQYTLREVLSVQSYQLPRIPHEDVFRFSTFSLSSFVIETTVASEFKALFLKALANRLQTNFADKPAREEQITELAKRITSVLAELDEADKEGQFEEKIDALFWGSYLSTLS